MTTCTLTVNLYNIVSPDKLSWCCHSCQEWRSKLQKQDSGFKKWNFYVEPKRPHLPKMLFHQGLLTWIGVYCKNSADVRLFFILTLLWLADSRRLEAGCGLTIFMVRRPSRFVCTDKRGVDRDICISPSRGCVYLKESVTWGNTGLLVQQDYTLFLKVMEGRRQHYRTFDTLWLIYYTLPTPNFFRHVCVATQTYLHVKCSICREPKLCMTWSVNSKDLVKDGPN